MDTARQIAFPLDDDSRAREPRLVLPGVVHIPKWLGVHDQRRLAAAFREWALAPAGLRHPRVPTGPLMSVQSVCLGWHWRPNVYTRTADDTDGATVKPLPGSLIRLARAAVVAGYGSRSAEAVDRRVGPFTDVDMRNGDLLVFGRENRRIFHGVPKVFPDTGPDDLGLPRGRLSVTVRETGLR